MSSEGFDSSELDRWSQQLIETAQRENPKRVNKFMRRQGNKLRTCVRRNARSRVKNKTGKYYKSIKRGKVYEYEGSKAIRTYTYAPHAHLVEDGHVLISHGVERGFVPGKKIFWTSESEFKTAFQIAVENDLFDEIITDMEK